MRPNYCFFLSTQITGAIQIIVGGGLIWLHIRYTPVVDSQFYKPALVLLILGPVLFILCWFGWNATAKKNRVHLGLVRALSLFFPQVLLLN